MGSRRRVVRVAGETYEVERLDVGRKIFRRSLIRISGPEAELVDQQVRREDFDLRRKAGLFKSGGPVPTKPHLPRRFQ